MFKKISQKCHDKAVQSNILWVNLNKMNEISILQSADKKVTPHFTCTETASAAPKYFPRLLQFWTGYRTSRAWKRKKQQQQQQQNERKNVDFHTAKKHPDTSNTCSLFLDDFL